MKIYKILASAATLYLFWLFGVATSKAPSKATTVIFTNDTPFCTIRDLSFQFSNSDILSDTSNTKVRLKPKGSFVYGIYKVDTLVGVRYRCVCTDSDAKIVTKAVVINRLQQNEVKLSCQ